MKSESKLKSLEQKIMIISSSFLELQMKEDQVFIHAILIKEKSGQKTKKETFSLCMQMGTQWKKCLFLSI